MNNQSHQTHRRSTISIDWLLLLSLFFSLLMACWVEHRVFTDPYAINDDVRNQAYWMLRLVKPDLFPDDLAAGYFTQSSMVAWPIKTLYALASTWINPIRFSQFLPFALVLLATWLWFKTATAWVNRRFAFWAGLLFNAYIWTASNMAGGLPRAFFYPLFFLFLWVFQQRKWLWVSITLILQSLIYPPALFLSLGVLGFDCVHRWKEPEGKIYNLPLSLVVSISGLAALAIRYAPELHVDSYGTLVTGNHAELLAEFYQGGRVPIFALDKSVQQGGAFSDFIYDILIRFPDWSWWVFFAGFLLVSIPYKKRLSRYLPELASLPHAFWDLPWIAIGLYGLASAFLFYLYVPARYLEYSMPITIICGIALLLYRLQDLARPRVSKIGQMLLTSILVLSTLGVSSFLWQDNLIKIYSDQQGVLQAIHRLPKDSRISASYWVIANDIPVFSERAVLLNREVNIPFHTEYYHQMKSHFQDWLKAYYAENPEIVLAFIDQYAIDYLIISQRDFTARAIRHAHSTSEDILPTGFVQQTLARQQQNRFWISRLNPSCISESYGPYLILDAKMLRNANCLPASAANH